MGLDIVFSNSQKIIKVYNCNFLRNFEIIDSLHSFYLPKETITNLEIITTDELRIFSKNLEKTIEFEKYVPCCVNLEKLITRNEENSDWLYMLQKFYKSYSKNDSNKSEYREIWLKILEIAPDIQYEPACTYEVLNGLKNLKQAVDEAVQNEWTAEWSW